MIIINPRYLKPCVWGDGGGRRKRRGKSRRRLSVES